MACTLRAAIVVLCLAAAGAAQGPQLETGSLPRVWRTGGPNCAEIPDWQIHEYNPDFYILRESGCSHYEKPFLYLIFGKDRALLEDTGAGNTDVERVVMELIGKWAKRNQREPVPLVVVHSHSHGDHRSGDGRFLKIPGTNVIAPEVGAIQAAFGIQKWPEELGSIDLGERTIDVLPIPGHDSVDLALYDGRTGLLLTGDTFYPGRLYVRNYPEYRRSIQRLVDFTATRPVAHILGTHIEQARTPFTDYKVRTTYQPDELPLELSRGDLLELHDALQRMGSTPEHLPLARFSIVPRTPAPQR